MFILPRTKPKRYPCPSCLQEGNSTGTEGTHCHLPVPGQCAPSKSNRKDHGAPSQTIQPKEMQIRARQNRNQRGKDFPSWRRARRLAEWPTFWKDGILDTNTKGQRFEAEEPGTQLGGPLIRERFAKPVEHRQIFPRSPEWKECGNQQGDQEVCVRLDTLTKSEAHGPISCHLFSSLVIDPLVQQRGMPWPGRRQAGPAPS